MVLLTSDDADSVAKRNHRYSSYNHNSNHGTEDVLPYALLSQRYNYQRYFYKLSANGIRYHLIPTLWMFSMIVYYLLLSNRATN